MNSAYPYLVSYVIVAMNFTMDGMDFKVVPYNIKKSDGLMPVMDPKIRNSQEYDAPVPILENTSKQLINNYFIKQKLAIRWANASSDWRILRYNQTGHFVQHQDRQRPVQGFIHFGTEIFLPPKSQRDFKGGQLVIWHKGKVDTVLPHQTLWTHVIIPLGMLHKVTKITQGIRVSFVKSIYVTKKKKTLKKNSTVSPTNTTNSQL